MHSCSALILIIVFINTNYCSKLLDCNNSLFYGKLWIMFKCKKIVYSPTNYKIMIDTCIFISILAIPWDFSTSSIKWIILEKSQSIKYNQHNFGFYNWSAPTSSATIHNLPFGLMSLSKPDMASQNQHKDKELRRLIQ